MANLENALQQLRAERREAQLHVQNLDQAILVIESLNGRGVTRKSTRPSRIMSAASRRKIARAQKVRWAKARKRSKSAAATPSAPVERTRTISATGKKRIAAAARLRWAKFRAAKKKAAA